MNVLTMDIASQTAAVEHEEFYPVYQHHEHEEHFHLDDKN